MAIAEEAEAGIPEWVVTFGDMMSLLLTFFIMLFSMSEIKEQERYQAMLEAMHRRFGYEATSESFVPGQSRPRNSQLAKLASLGRSKRMDTMRGGDKVRAPVGENPKVEAIRPAEHTTIGGVLYFPGGGSELSEENQRKLQEAAREIGGKPQKIEIRVHTSTQPLETDSPYGNCWDLAYARCAVVRDFLVKLGINPRRIRIGVAANNEPVRLGDDPLLQKKNSRVEIFMLNEWIRDLEGTGDEKDRQYSTEVAP